MAKIDLQQEARAFLQTALDASGVSAAALAKRAHISPSTITRPLNDPSFEFTPRAATLQKIADAAGIALPAVFEEKRSRRPDSALLPIRRRVQAGAWLAVDDANQLEPKRYPAAVDPRWPQANQWLSEVVGDSMNALNILEGDLVHCVDIWAIHYTPRTGDIVEVERLRFDGGEVEVTLKQAVVTDAGIELWPRSTNPRWSKPLLVTEGTLENEEVTVSISGIVISVIRRTLLT